MNNSSTSNSYGFNNLYEYDEWGMVSTGKNPIIFYDHQSHISDILFPVTHFNILLSLSKSFIPILYTF